MTIDQTLEALRAEVADLRARLSRLDAERRRRPDGLSQPLQDWVTSSSRVKLADR
jgi:hypothetical protein